MKPITKLRNAFVQLALLVFLMNTTAAYGACCLIQPAADEPDALLTTLPCHQTDDSKMDKPSSDDCCAFCAPMMAGFETDNLKLSNNPRLELLSILTQPTGGFDPPFRPPAPNLS